MTKLLSFVLGLLLCINAAIAAPSLDGHAENNGASSSGSATVTLTTSSTNDIIVVAVTLGKQDTVGTTLKSVSSISDTAGLTWHKRRSQVVDALSGASTTTHIDSELWWASSAGALTSDVITLTFSGATDNWAVSAYGVNGVANLTSPWDPNVSLPAVGTDTVQGGSNVAITVSGVNTTTDNDFLIAQWSAYNSFACGHFDASFTNIGCASNSAGNAYAQVDSGYKVVSGTVSGASYTDQAGINNIHLTAYDALVGSSPLAPTVGAATSGGFQGASTSGTITKSCSAGDVIVVAIHITHQSSYVTVSSVAGASLTWNMLSRGQHNFTTTYNDAEIWYAKAPSGFTSQTITVTASAATDATEFTGFCVSGTNSTTPLDPNGSLPSVYVSSTIPGGATFTTTHANDLLISFRAMSDNTEVADVPSGYTNLIDSINGSGAVRYAHVHVDYQSVTATQSGATAAYNVSAEAQVMTGIALTSDATIVAGGGSMVLRGVGN